MTYLRNLSVLEALMIAAGAVIFLASAFVLWGRRWDTHSDAKPRFSFPGVGYVSEPTRLLVGFVGVVLAYHLMVWALPARATPVQFHREYWWAVVLIGVGAVVGSLMMDRSQGGSPPDGKGGETPST